ncbi:hypothetical protein PIB30_049430 [Stylosanthes scabra]|uniref:Uncharacterized protein n=1 Tax=Stylosanthes scabra TaxID=79078 RepID=A0ABU6SHF0_9FABA|nr:hypothetical protein [Stylosanthes scabra]
MALATIPSFPSIKFNTTHQLNNSLIFLPKQYHSHRIFRLRRIQCNGTEHTQQEKSQQPQNNNNDNNNALLKVAWYSSELLGIAASALRPSSNEKAPLRLLESIDRGAVVDTIKQDFQRSYFVTGDLTLNAYEDNCEFADPAGSFKGLQRFKRNCTNFGSLLEKSNMKLMKWEDFEACGALECSENGLVQANSKA